MSPVCVRCVRAWCYNSGGETAKPTQKPSQQQKPVKPKAAKSALTVGQRKSKTVKAIFKTVKAKFWTFKTVKARFRPWLEPF